jgi:hypothetical protein
LTSFPAISYEAGENTAVMEPPSASPGRVSLKAIDPASGKETEVLVSHRRMHTVGRRSVGHAAECGILVPYTLQHPSAIFEGLRRDSDEAGRTPGWYCYCSTPPCSFDEDGNRQPPYAGQVFLVFVNREKVVYSWRWEKADKDDKSLPENHDQRFERRAL